MVPVKNHQQRTRRRRHKHQPVLRKRVVPEPAPAFGRVAHHVLLALVRAVQRRQVDVRARVVDRGVRGRGPEERVGDDGREGECEGGVAAGVRLELCRTDMKRQWACGRERRDARRRATGAAHRTPRPRRETCSEAAGGPRGRRAHTGGRSGPTQASTYYSHSHPPTASPTARAAGRRPSPSAPASRCARSTAQTPRGRSRRTSRAGAAASGRGG